MSRNKLALDCEMVGSGNESLLARVSIVDEYGRVLLDEYVRPTAPVTDYRTIVSGITKNKIATGQEFSTVKRQVERILSGCILIGHSLNFDLNVLKISHPERNIRDLSDYEPFKRLNQGNPASLKFLAKHYLGRYIQQGEHDSVEDAKASMEIYQKVAREWERNY